MKRIGLVLLTIASLRCASVPIAGGQAFPPRQRFQLAPVDEAANDPTFNAFRSLLIAAIGRRDAQFIIESSVPALQRSFAGWLDRPLSSSAWASGPPYEAPDWRELERLLSLGGSFTTTNGSRMGRLEFCAPYTYSAYPANTRLNPIVEAMAGHDDVPEADPWVILGARVPALAQPSPTARIMKYLSHDLVLTGDELGTPPNWIGVFVADGALGWVTADQIRDPRDYHACFAQIDGRWLMTEFGRGRVPSGP